MAAPWRSGRTLDIADQAGPTMLYHFTINISSAGDQGLALQVAALLQGREGKGHSGSANPPTAAYMAG